MIYAGLDVGTTNCKITIFDNDLIKTQVSPKEVIPIPRKEYFLLAFKITFFTIFKTIRDVGTTNCKITIFDNDLIIDNISLSYPSIRNKNKHVIEKIFFNIIISKFTF